ncbi:M50 family metallopeptidase [Nonomuraea sp. NPDC050556]|uniref:M50 family metallopeptidase n=1 Tax=Nonomuraea sp. NPDC050556 TaxID=3364369 RepID=UPI0037B82641
MDRYGFATGVVALVLVGFPITWALVGPLVAAVHEAGHAVVGILCGRKVKKIRIEPEHRGSTEFDRNVNTLMTMAGYLSPPFAGLAAAHAVKSGYADLVLWVLVFVLGSGLVLLVRNLFGALAVALTAVVLWIVAAKVGAPAREAVAHVVAWVLMLGGVRSAFTIQGMNVEGRADGSDPVVLQSLTGLPAVLWSMLLAGAGCYALYSGAVVLIPSWAP